MIKKREEGKEFTKNIIYKKWVGLERLGICN